MKKKIILFGSSGLIGSSLKKYLEKHHDVIGIDKVKKKNSNFLFVKLVAGTFIFLLLTYVAFNTAMVVGILPVVGMPLPFLSQGGTALIINMIMIGIILSFRRTV